jgi:hypothetical protein
VTGTVGADVLTGTVVSAGLFGVSSLLTEYGAFFMGPTGGYMNMPLRMYTGAKLTIDDTLRVSGALEMDARTMMPTPVLNQISGGVTATLTSYYQLGRWFSPLAGRMLKLNVVACARGHLINRNGVSPSNPSIVDLDIYFHSSNDEYTGCFGWGWCISRHVNSRPLAALVLHESRTVFWFYVKLAALPGEILATATKSLRTEWDRSVAGPFSVPPGTPFNAKALSISAEHHSLCGDFAVTDSR